MATAQRAEQQTGVAPVALASAPRHAWMDNLRVAVIAGVIVTHVAATYAVPMPWYYEERTAGDPTVILLSSLTGPPVLFAMALLFLVAGMLSPRSMRRKGARQFIVERLLRLGVPLIATVVVIVPATALVGEMAEGALAPRDAGSFLARRLIEADTGVMWFGACLLLFSIAYAAYRSVRRFQPRSDAPIRARHLMAAAAATAIGSWAIRLEWPALSVTPFHLNLWDWPSMAALFVLGIVAGERGWLQPVPVRLRRRCGWIALASLGLAMAFFAAIVATGDDRLLGGPDPRALILPAIEGGLAVSASVWFAGWFQLRWTAEGKLARGLARGSYGAYVLHPLVIVLLAVALRSLAMPAEVKFLAVAAVGIAASFALAWALTRSGPVSRLL